MRGILGDQRKDRGGGIVAGDAVAAGHVPAQILGGDQHRARIVAPMPAKEAQRVAADGVAMLVAAAYRIAAGGLGQRLEILAQVQPQMRRQPRPVPGKRELDGAGTGLVKSWVNDDKRHSSRPSGGSATMRPTPDPPLAPRHG